MRSMEDVVGDAIARPRFLTLLLGIFAGLALVLAAVGTYGMLSYLVSRAAAGDRDPDGARRGPREILRLVLGRGLVLSRHRPRPRPRSRRSACTRVLETLLFNVKPTDPLTLAVVAGVMVARRRDRVRRAGVARDAGGSARDAETSVSSRLGSRLGARGSGLRRGLGRAWGLGCPALQSANSHDQASPASARIDVLLAAPCARSCATRSRLRSGPADAVRQTNSETGATSAIGFFGPSHQRIARSASGSSAIAARGLQTFVLERRRGYGRTDRSSV